MGGSHQRVLALGSMLFSGLQGVLLVVGSAAPYWVVSWGVHYGLWQVCVDGDVCRGWQDPAVYSYRAPHGYQLSMQTVMGLSLAFLLLSWATHTLWLTSSSNRGRHSNRLLPALAGSADIITGLLALVGLLLFRGWHTWRMVHGWATWLVFVNSSGLMLLGAVVLYRMRPLGPRAVVIRPSHLTLPQSQSSLAVPDPQAQPLFGPRAHRPNGEVCREKSYCV